MKRIVSAMFTSKRSSKIGLAAMLLAVFCSTSACATPGRPSTDPPVDPISVARELPDASGIIMEGDASKTCGEYVLSQGETLPDEVMGCLSAASLAGDPAELAWSEPTTEGDPIVSFAFVGGSIEGVQVYTTTAFDQYSGDEYTWSGIHCPDPTDLRGDKGDCQPLIEG